MKPKLFFLIALIAFVQISKVHAQANWTAVVNPAPHANEGGMALLSDGSVLVKTDAGGGDGYGNIYDRLTPDASGSYINGTWTSIAPMTRTRLWYSSQLLKDGRLYVCGGEYGTDGKNLGANGEVYNPLTNIWTPTPMPGGFVSDANSEILEDGRIMQAIVRTTVGTANYFGYTKIYDPASNSFTNGPFTVGDANESAWLKLPDNSILFIDNGTINSERYIPSMNQWVADSSLPAGSNLYDVYGSEMGGAFLLPNGKGFFVGATGKTAIYTPSGNNTNGSWIAGPDIPGNRGVPDGPGAIMVDGKILLAVSPAPYGKNDSLFTTPTSFVIYDYLSNTFTDISSPIFAQIGPSYATNMITLPSGQVLFSRFGFPYYSIYTPTGSPLAAGKPSIATITQLGPTSYRITGTKFNGISQGASYGDDWQMNTNYPIVSLNYSSNKIYCRSHDWNSTGVQRGTQTDTAYFEVPAGLPNIAYNLVVTANGISSDPKIMFQNFSAAVSISSSPGTYVCNGTIINFTATPTNGGTPSYQWQKNGSDIIGATGNTFSSNTLHDRDAITCVMTSNVVGVTGSPATSNAKLMTIYENNAVITASATPSAICAGQTTVLAATAAYCQPAFTNPSNNPYINSVSLGTINNTSGAANSPYYTLYPSSGNTTTSLVANQIYSLTVGTNRTYTDSYVAAWIDFDQDKSFSADEELAMAGNIFANNSTVLTFGVPTNAKSGQTRLRIRLFRGISYNPCTTLNYGETEDYVVTITNGSAATPINYSWSTQTNPYLGASISATPTYSQVYTVTATDVHGCTTSAITSAVTVNNINLVAAASSSAICSGVSSTLTASVGSNYCSSFFYSTGTSMGNYIASHQIIDLTNTYNIVMDYTSGASSAPYYTLFPASGNTTTTLIAGNTYSISFNTGPSTNNKITAFIDYDKNKLLDEGFEKIGQITMNGSSYGYFYFVVPINAKNGITRLRLRLSGDGYYKTSCESGSVGETEDYDITITGGVNPVSPIYTWSNSPNPATGNTVTASPTVSTNYIVTATAADGCTATASAPVLVHAPVTLNMSAPSPASICAGQSTTLAVSASSNSYCQPISTSGTGGGDFISSVYIPFTTMSNSSGAALSPYYTLYPQSGSSTATLTAGSGYYITINVGSFSSYNNVAAWIDYDGDGTFFSPLEKLGESGDINTAYGSSSLIFKVPTWAKNGTCRLRVRETYNQNNLDPCITYTFGETEDYDITITGGVNPTSLTYAWLPATSPTTGNTVSASPTSATTYTVTTTGNYGCTNTATATVNMNTNAQYYSNATSVCLGTPIDFNASTNACSGNAFNGNGSSYAATLLSSYATTAINNMTFEAWVKWNGTTGSNQFIYYNGNSNLNGYGIIVNAGNANKLTVYLGGVAALNSTITLTPNVWQHVAVTKGGPAGGTWRLFVDGTQYTLTGSTTVALTPGSGGTYVGRSNNLSEYFNGAIDEVRIWSTAISSFLIPNERVACITAPQTNLVGYWKFNEAIGGTTSCTDASGGNRTLTLSNVNARTATANYAWNYGDATTGNGITSSHTYPSSNNYTVTLTVTDITGCAASSIQSIYVNPCISNLYLTLYIEGYYQGSGMMTTALANAGVGNSFMDVDSVTVELHNVMPPFAAVYTTTGILQTYGNLNCTFPFAAAGNSYYVAIKHRNSIETWSKLPVSMSLNTSFNFTSQ